MRTAAVLCIGDELLDGRIADENARHLTSVADRRGLDVTEIRVVGDDESAIEAALEALQSVDVVVTTGGLGPTDDDVTRWAVSSFVDRPLVEDDASLKRLKDRFERHDREFTDINRRQCRFPDGAAILESEVGTADGFSVERGDTRYYFFPGVPREFRWFVERYLHAPAEEAPAPFRKTLSFFGPGESSLATRLEEVIDEIAQRDLTAGFRADFPLVELTLKGDDTRAGDIERRIREQVGQWLVAEGDQSLSSRVGDRLVESDATVCVVESCTAGMLGAMITEVSGSSRYFEEGYLTYSNDAKTRLVGVNPDTLEEVGAVSPQVAAQMAAGGRRRSGADYAMAISGVAGPTGGTEHTPVGTVDVAVATPQGVFHRRSLFSNRSRRQVRGLSVHVAMALLLWHLEDRLSEHRVRGPFSSSEVERGIRPQ